MARAKELGMDSLAITDHGVMYGVVAFYKGGEGGRDQADSGERGVCIPRIPL